MYFSFQHNGNLRAARARHTNLVHAVGGVDRHTFIIGNTVHIEAARCTPCTREEATAIEAAFDAARAERIAAAKAAYFSKVRA
jgi:hypothetical protein